MLENVKFANPKLEKITNLFAIILNDGGRYADAVITAEVSHALQPKKNGCPYGLKDEVTKITKYGISVNGNYATAVNNQKARENKVADHVSKPAWFVRIFDAENGCIVAKRAEVEAGIPLTETYIFFVSNNAETTEFFIGGKPATEEETTALKMWGVDRVESASNSQGLDKPIIVNTVKLTGVKEIHANKIRIADCRFM